MTEPDFREDFTIDEPGRLGELIGDAKIVAIGENNHHLHEFGVLRDRLLRYLVEDHGFRVVGVETGFAEGFLVDKWLAGGSGGVADIGRDGFTFSLGDSPEVHEMLTWLRGRADVRFAGLDVPSSAGSPEPALLAVRAYLEEVDPPMVSLVDDALAATAPYASVSSALSPAKYAQLDVVTRNAATAALAVLVTQLASLRPLHRSRSSVPAQAVAEHHAAGALRVDTYQREVAAMMAGTAPELQGSSRDTYMADTVRLLRAQYGEDARIVLLLHNGHLQRLPFAPAPGLTFPSAGTHLAEEFGDDYFALGLTAGGGVTTALATDPAARLGFRVFAQALEPPADGSVEQVLAGAGPSLIDLRAQRGLEATSIRHAHLFTQVDVAKAFDALIYLPETTVSAHL